MLATMNVLRERYEFHRRQQRPHESIEQFAAEIRRLTASCQYSDFEETLIRDHVLFGLRNKKIAFQIIDQGGDPSLYEIIDICVRSGRRRARNARQYTIGDEKPFEEIEVKNEPVEEDFEMLPTYSDTTPDAILSICHLPGKNEAGDVKYAAQMDEANSVSSPSRRWDTEIRPSIATTAAELEANFQITEGAVGISQCAKELLIPSPTKRPFINRSKRCRQCQRTFKKMIDFRNHVLSMHNEASCRFCRKEFKNQVTFGCHLKAYHPETIKGNEGRQYECHVCRRAMKSIPKLRKHFIEHFRVKNYLCPQCGYIAGTRQGLEKHLMRNDHNTTGAAIKPFKCDICGQTFITRYTLDVHKTSHSDARNFPCPICGKAFKNRKNMKQHHIRHGEKTHQCQLCAYSCFSTPSLNLHMKVHTGGSFKQE